MKKQEIIKLGKEKYNLDSKTVNIVLEFVFALSKEKVFLLEELDQICYGQIIFIFEKLLSGYPLAYITKNINFMGIDFFVDENVLIPRDDTEILVREVISEIINDTTPPTSHSFRFPSQLRGIKGEFTDIILLDIGTGSGIIPISIAKNTNIEKIIALDISKEAQEVAKINVVRHNLEDKITLINADFRDFDYEKFKGENLVITANLPYIREGDFNNMDFSVYKFEPKQALYGGKETGFELYEELIELLINKRNIFKSLGLFIEIGFDQYEISKDFLEKKGLKFEFSKDTNNIHRVIKINI